MTRIMTGVIHLPVICPLIPWLRGVISKTKRTRAYMSANHRADVREMDPGRMETL